MKGNYEWFGTNSIKPDDRIVDWDRPGMTLKSPRTLVGGVVSATTEQCGDRDQ